jgi:hypothetical protein
MISLPWKEKKMNELENARRCLVDAERFADDNDPDLSQAYTAVANAWLRLEELKTQKKFVNVFETKRMSP